MKRAMSRESLVVSEASADGVCGLRSALREPLAAGARGQRALVSACMRSLSESRLCVALCASRLRREFEGKALVGLILLTSMLLFSACGFEPQQGKAYRESLAVNLSDFSVSVSGNTTTTSATTGSSSTASISRRYSELLRAQIEDAAGAGSAGSVPGAKPYHLAITYTALDIALFVNPDGTASRGDLLYSSNYTITRRDTGAVLANGSLSRTSSYNTSPTADYASYVSLEDARKRGVLELAEDYRLRLATLLPTLNTPNATALEAKPAVPLPELRPVRQYETNSPR